MLKDFKVFREEQVSKLAAIPKERHERPDKTKKKPDDEKKKPFLSKTKPVVKQDQVKVDEPVADSKTNENFQEDKQFWEFYDKNT